MRVRALIAAAGLAVAALLVAFAPASEAALAGSDTGWNSVIVEPLEGGEGTVTLADTGWN